MNKNLSNVPSAGTNDEQRTTADNSRSASVEANPMLCAGRVYVIEVDKGAWDSWSWWIHGIYDSQIKADEAKKTLLSKIEKDKKSKDWLTSHDAKQINEVRITEYKLNDVVSR
jgi:hypothetical protein